MVIGATGYIGSAVAEALEARGHEVLALSRPGKPGRPGRPGRPGGYGLRSGDLADPASLCAAAADVDVVVHAAPPLGDEQADTAAITALLESGARLVYTSGVWVLGASGSAALGKAALGKAALGKAAPDETALDETAPTNPLPIVAYRPRLEQQVLAAGGVVLRPGIVHGRGGGIPSMLVGWAREASAGRYVGGVGTRWPMVHVDDLAELFALAVESAKPGSVLHGVTEEAVSTVALAAAADQAAGGPGNAQPWPTAADTVGEPFAQALALDQAVTSTQTRTTLGWTPHHPTALTDLTTGSY
ncbi:NAD-dependent epimerase/dehydratase family protein [Saccharothrix sp. NPDC042600]|uniref:NAD-dependent epimerase/dehydratase family protein n=1 Tax=Saccharothrix TaxID=2071 RepID=UPI0033C68106